MHTRRGPVAARGTQVPSVQPAIPAAALVSPLLSPEHLPIGAAGVRAGSDRYRLRGVPAVLCSPLRSGFASGKAKPTRGERKSSVSGGRTGCPDGVPPGRGVSSSCVCARRARRRRARRSRPQSSRDVPPVRPRRCPSSCPLEHHNLRAASCMSDGNSTTATRRARPVRSAAAAARGIEREAGRAAAPRRVSGSAPRRYHRSRRGAGTITTTTSRPPPFHLRPFVVTDMCCCR